jgi:hypothetical protein
VNADELLKECLRALNTKPNFSYGDGRASYWLATQIEKHLESPDKAAARMVEAERLIRELATEMFPAGDIAEDVVKFLRESDEATVTP